MSGGVCRRNGRASHGLGLWESVRVKLRRGVTGSRTRTLFTRPNGLPVNPDWECVTATSLTSPTFFPASGMV